MASITPRASGLWTSSARMSSYEDDEDLEGLLPREIDLSDSRTPLDRTIDRIGMGTCMCISSQVFASLPPRFDHRKLPMDTTIALRVW